MDGSLLHMHEGCEVLYKLRSPFRVTGEAGDEGCHCNTIQTEPCAAIG